jgi:polyisoprenoid-binding protein YceI
MKFWTVVAVAAALAGCNQPTEQPAEEPPAQVAVEVPSGEYALDRYHSTLTVRVSRFGLSNYMLRFNALDGVLNFDADNPERSTVVATVDTTSLDTTYSGDRNFDAELQNSAWLDTATHPTATFRSTAVERTGPNTARVTGDLTLKGATHPLTLDVTYNRSWRQHPLGGSDYLIGFSGRGTFRRSEFGMSELQPRGGAQDGIGDEIELLIEAEFMRPVEQAPPGPTTVEPVN